MMESFGGKPERKYLQAKAYLREYHSLALRRDSLVEEPETLQRADALAYGKADSRQSSPKPKKGQQALGILLEHIEKSLAVRLVLIERLPNEHQKMILINRYIRCCSWEDIGRRVGYVPRYAQRIHNQALEQLEAMLTEFAQDQQLQR